MCFAYVYHNVSALCRLSRLQRLISFIFYCIFIHNKRIIIHEGDAVKERAARLRAIKKILNTNTIKSQELLLEKLSNNGFNVTQATLSRDLKLLKVAKISSGAKGYYYTLPGEDQLRESDQSFLQDILRGFISLDYSGNIGVMHTMPGHADSVAFALDNLGLQEILGTMAGDDTIIIVLREGFSGKEFMKNLQKWIPELEL